jgi:hypothetical protein
VNPGGAGAILVHRLLEAWPAEKLMVVTPGATENCPLPGVRKVSPPPNRRSRLYHSRFALPYMTWRVLRNMARLRLKNGRPPEWLRPELELFAPEAVLTVGIAGTWMNADAYARREGLPLHVIIHDDHHYAFFWIKPLRKFGENLFGKTYRRAVSRLCVSEPMRQAYCRRFGVDGKVLLPSRGRESVSFDAPRSSIADRMEGLTVIYAGSVYGNNFRTLEDVAAALAERGHKLVVYTPSQPPIGFQARHMEIRAPLPSAELVKNLHAEADLLLLWTDFSEDNREITKTLFPSKLVDYTAAAVSVLVVAPPDACIVDYLSKRPQAGELSTDPLPKSVAMRVDELARDPQRRRQLAEGAVAAGKEDFDYEKAFGRFCAALSGSKESQDNQR